MAMGQLPHEAATCLPFFHLTLSYEAHIRISRISRISEHATRRGNAGAGTRRLVHSGLDSLRASRYDLQGRFGTFTARMRWWSP